MGSGYVRRGISRAFLVNFFGPLKHPYPGCCPGHCPDDENEPGPWSQLQWEKVTFGVRNELWL